MCLILSSRRVAYSEPSEVQTNDANFNNVKPDVRKIISNTDYWHQKLKIV